MTLEAPHDIYAYKYRRVPPPPSPDCFLFYSLSLVVVEFKHPYWDCAIFRAGVYGDGVLNVAQDKEKVALGLCYSLSIYGTLVHLWTT